MRPTPHRPSSSREPEPEDFLERDDDENIGFFGALMFNGMLGGIRAGLKEAMFATDQIPRYPYPDPFRREAPRAKVSKNEEEDDE